VHIFVISAQCVNIERERKKATCAESVSAAAVAAAAMTTDYI